MKAKIKNLDSAKKVGFKKVKKLVKDLLKDASKEPSWFFYDAQFEYGEGTNDVLPILYIGPKIAAWKQYCKEKKQDPFFVEGICAWDKEGRIKVVPATGKGHKPKVTKILNKELLKPFGKLFVVESLEAPLPEEANNFIADMTEEGSESSAPDSATPTPDPVFDAAALETEVGILVEDGQEALDALGPVIAGLAPRLANIRDTIVTDDLLDETAEALKVINKYQLPIIYRDLMKWLKDAKKRYAGEASAEPLLKQVEKLAKDLALVAKDLAPVEKNAAKLQKVQSTDNNEVAPVSDDPFENMANQIIKTSNTSVLNTAHSDSKNFK